MQADTKKVLIITYYWPPSGGAGVQRWLKFVKYLQEFNVEPVILTVDERKGSYPVKDNNLVKEIPSTVRVYKTSTCEPFNLYKTLSGKTEIPFGGFANETKKGLFAKLFRFIRGNLFIPDARVGWSYYVIKKASQILHQEKFDAIITSSPPHSTQLAGLYLRKKFKLRWIADLRDPWTDIYYYRELAHMPLVKKIDRVLEKKVLIRADDVIVVSEEIKRMFCLKDTRIDPAKIHIIPNGFDDKDFNENISINKNEFKIAYTGTITKDYRPSALFEAIKELSEQYIDTQIKLIMAGNLDQEILAMITSAGIQNLMKYKGYVNHDISIKIIKEADVLYLSIPDVKSNKGILTGKLFEYLAAEKPIICTGPEDGEAAAIIRNSNSGRTFSYSDKEGIKEFMEILLLKWKEGLPLSGNNQNFQKFSRKNLTLALADIIKR